MVAVSVAEATAINSLKVETLIVKTSVVEASVVEASVVKASVVKPQLKRPHCSKILLKICFKKTSKIEALEQKHFTHFES